MKAKTKVLLIGIYDTNTISLAPRVLKSYVSQFPVASNFEIIAKEFSIFIDSPESIVAKISEEKPDVVGYSTYIWNINYVLEIVKHVNATNILGGPQVTGIERDLITENPDIDIIVTGEGEVSFKELLEYLAGLRRLGDVKCITTKEMQTDRGDPLEELDSIPSFYENTLGENPEISWISYETSRGCPMSCKFCTWSHSKRMRYLSLERVKSDLDVILGHHNIEHIYLCDSNLLLNKNRAISILRHLVDSESRIAMRFEFDAEQLDDEIINLLVKLPGDEFNFGIQSTNKHALDDMGRRFRQDKFESNYYKLLGKLSNPNITIDLIYGLPGDDIEGYLQSLNYAISLDGVKRILTNPLIVLPGSEFYRYMDKYQIKIRDKKSYILKENYTFCEEHMMEAKKVSFFVSMIYLNERLRDSVKAFAQQQKISYVDAISSFMESLPFDITGGLGYPYMIPSVKEDFEHRNNVMKKTLNRYDDMVAFFRETSYHEFDTILSDYKNSYTEHYYKLRKFAGFDSG